MVAASTRGCLLEEISSILVFRSRLRGLESVRVFQNQFVSLFVIA